MRGECITGSAVNSDDGVEQVEDDEEVVVEEEDNDDKEDYCCISDDDCYEDGDNDLWEDREVDCEVMPLPSLHLELCDDLPARGGWVPEHGRICKFARCFA